MAKSINVSKNTDGTKNSDMQIPTALTAQMKRKHLIPNWVLKVIMAVTGTVFVGFICFHLFGNIKILFETPEEYDAYAVWLRHLLNPLLPGTMFLWCFRAVLFGCLILHVASGITIYVRARIARGETPRKFISKRVPARTMVWTGIILLCFIIFHLLDLTVGQMPFASSHFKEGQAYYNLIYSFQRPAVAFFYFIVMVLLAFHIAHGVWSIVNDFGGTGKRLRSVIFILAGIIGFVAVAGNALIVIAVQVGYLHL
jgi:succinate dehydrogenase / fumarate reductase cytochrome b subunit